MWMLVQLGWKYHVGGLYLPLGRSVERLGFRIDSPTPAIVVVTLFARPIN